MYKLLIVDDEAVEREAIQYFIKKAGLEFNAVQEAANGIQAVSKAKELLPEIIIMDIKMPGMTGLESAKEIRLFIPHCRIIFLTAFDEFDYAHQAIKVKAEDFIIKPANGNNLIELLRRVILDLDERKAYIERHKNLESMNGIFKKWFESDLLFSIAMGYIEERRLKDYFDSMNISFTTALCAIIRFSQSSAASTFAVYSEDHIKQRIKSIIKAELDSKKLKHLSGGAYNSIYVMIMTNDTTKDDKNWGENIFGCIKKAVWRQLGMEIQVGIGSLFQKPEEASNSFFQAKIACKSAVNIERVVNFKSMVKEKQSTQYPLKEEKKLCEGIVKGDEIEAERCIEEIMDWISQFSGSMELIKEKVHELLIIIDRAVIKEFDIETAMFQNRFTELAGLNSTNEIIIFIKSVVSEIIGRINILKNSPSALLINKVCNYIDQNYQKEIKLDEMCDMAGFSKYYFSKIFKQHKNLNFVDYITLRRMEKAKELLKDYKQSIKEIGSEIGYSDANYFTSVFKKWEGISPTEYRSKYLR